MTNTNSEDHLSKEEAFQIVKALQDESRLDTEDLAAHDQDEP